MDNKFYQACFSHPAGEWTLLNSSEDIPSEMLNFFQAAESANQTVNSVDSECMFEIISKNGTVGIVRVQYGLTEPERGRTIFFSRGFLFQDAYNLLKNPNDLLCIANSNFDLDVTEWNDYREISAKPGAVVRECAERSAAIPLFLKKTKPFTIDTCLEKCGFDREAYIHFIEYVTLFVLTSEKEVSLFIRTDGTEEQARALLFLLYSSVPYSLREKITAATIGKAGKQSSCLIFGKNIPDFEKFIDPVSGENNIYNKEVFERLEKSNPFAGYFSGQYGKDLPDSTFFYCIEACLQKMGDIHLSDKESLNTAFRMFMVPSGIEYNAIDRLDDWLCLPVETNKSWNEMAAAFLKQTLDKKLRLPDIVNEHLERRIEEEDKVHRDGASELQTVYFQYVSKTLTEKPTVDAAEYLKQLGEGSIYYRKLRTLLQESPAGNKILRKLFLDKAVEICERQDLEYDDLLEPSGDADGLSCQKEVYAILANGCQKIAEKKIYAGENFDSVMEGYRKAVSEIAPGTADDRKTLAELYEKKIITEFDPEKIGEYRKFVKEYPMQTEALANCLSVIDDIDEGKKSSIQRAVEKLKVLKDWPELTEIIKGYALKKEHEENESLFIPMEFWEILLESESNQSLIAFAGDNDLRALYDLGYLRRQFADMGSFWRRDYDSLKKYTTECKEYISSHPEKKAALTDSYRELTAQLKNMEAEIKMNEKRNRSAKNKIESEIREAPVPLMSTVHKEKTSGKYKEKLPGKNSKKTRDETSDENGSWAESPIEEDKKEKSFKDKATDGVGNILSGLFGKFKRKE